MFSAALAGRVSLSRFVDLVSTAPAKLFGLYPRKGEIQVGSDGDLVVFDPTIEEVMGKSSFCQTYDYSPYEGFRLKGAPRFVIARGEVVAANGAYVGRPGAGQYLVRSAASTAV
jgi:dihydropyrimidinase